MIDAKGLVLAAILALLPLCSIAAGPPVGVAPAVSAGVSRPEGYGLIEVKGKKGGDHDADDRDRDDRGGRRHGGGNHDTPPGWSHGAKTGWGGHDMPPGLRR